MFNNFMSNYHEMAIKSSHDSLSSPSTFARGGDLSGASGSGYVANNAPPTSSSGDEHGHHAAYTTHPQSKMQIVIKKALEAGFLKKRFLGYSIQDEKAIKKLTTDELKTIRECHLFIFGISPVTGVVIDWELSRRSRAD